MKKELTIPGYIIHEVIHEGNATLILRGSRERDNKPTVLKTLVSGYPDPNNHMDFHAYAEVYIGGHWFTTDARFRSGRISVRLWTPFADWFRTCWTGATNSRRLAGYYVRRNSSTRTNSDRDIEADTSRNGYNRQRVSAVEHRFHGRGGNPFRPGERV